MAPAGLHGLISGKNTTLRSIAGLLQPERLEARKKQRIGNDPFILVTHDPDEARFLGDQVLYMQKGRQIGLATSG